MLDSFVHLGHLCIVFEPLARNLFELLRSTEMRGVSLGLARRFAEQLVDVLQFLQLPQLNLMHTDLKVRDPPDAA